MLRRAALLAALAALLPTAPALAAPPANDARAAAATLASGGDLRGTTVEATREEGEPAACPEGTGGTVWYRVNAGQDGGFVRLGLDTDGGLDASLAVYELERSTLTQAACASTRRGTVTLGARLDGGTYLVRVGTRPGATPGTFRLRYSGVLDEPSPPGRALGADGRAAGTLDAFTRPFALFSRTLRAGRSYRVRVAVGDPASCDAVAQLLDPDGDVRASYGCRGYSVITPGPDDAGRWSVRLRAGGGTAGDLRYRVAIVPPGSDDLAPGRFLSAFGRVRDSVSGRGPDAQDVLRFDVTRRAEITLSLKTRGRVSMSLRTDRGKRVTSADASADEDGQIRTRLRPGRFFLVVSAARSAGGRYTLSRLTRAITSTTVTFDGRGTARKGPGGSSTVGVQVSQASNGRATVVLERFDPQFGWRFWQRRTIRISGGSGAFAVDTSAIGRYRARAEFLGTRERSPSRARRAARLVVQAPLRD